MSSKKHSALLRMMGALFAVLGISFIPTVIIALIYGEYFEGLCFGCTMAACGIVGLILMKFFNPSDLKLKQRDGFLIVSLIWIISSIIGAVPMVLTGAIPNPFDAFFELCSGFSTTGATIMTDIESQAKSVLFWRSFTHWLGGMGIVVLATALLPSIGIGGQNVASAETPGPTLTKVTARFSDNSKTLYILYIGFTVVEFILLLVGGMSAYDSAIHTFGTVGTGGFSNYADSIAHFSSPYLQWVIIIFMALCGINFNLYFFIPRKRFKDFFADEELRLYLGILFVFSFASAIVLMLQGGYASVSKAIRDSFFHIIAVMTTTGYATADFDLWPAFCKMLIFIVLITGACSSSTGGGVKMIRILAAIKYVKRGFFQKLHPNRIINMTINKIPVQQSVVTNIVNFIFLYIAVLFVGTLLIAVDGKDLVTSFTAVLTCLSNVGPGFNGVGPTMNFSGFSDYATFVLSILMIAGRLELFTLLVLFSPRYWDSNRV